MKAKELAEELLKNPDFEVKFSVMETITDELGDLFLYMKRFGNLDIVDVGHSDKVIILGGDEI